MREPVAETHAQLAFSFSSCPASCQCDRATHIQSGSSLLQLNLCGNTFTDTSQGACGDSNAQHLDTGDEPAEMGSNAVT